MRWVLRGFWCVSLVFVSALLVTQARSARSRESDQLTIHVWKQRHRMWLQQGDTVLRKFDIALGKDPTVSKLVHGDGRTPEGHYYICEKQPRSRFRRFLGISYPNIDDAEKAFTDHLITADQWADIFFANLRQTTPPWQTALGGRVGIHGYGGRDFVPIDWTEGCIAVSDEDIDYLYDRVPLGTPVIITD